MNKLRFALTGNPNSGKTTLFNYLTGASAKVGNWPGVTVERIEGVYKTKYLCKEVEATLIDLPGIYGLDPYSPEEVITRKYIFEEKPDLVINVVDMTNLERNLFLTTQLLEIDVPIIVALNMADLAKKEGLTVLVDELTKKLGVVCVPISAATGEGIDSLMQKAFAVSKHKRQGWTVLEHDKDFAALFRQVKDIVSPTNELSSQAYHIIKFIEGDELEVKTHPETAAEVARISKQYFENEDDFSGKIASLRYEYLRRELPAIQSKSASVAKSDWIDKILTNRWIGIPLFLIVMFLVFHLTFSEDLFFIGALFIPEGSFSLPIIGTDAINSPGAMLASGFEWLTDWIGGGLVNLTSTWPPWLSGLLVDGLWGGVGAILSFIPQILLLFVFIAILEDSGYMARAAFVMDSSLRRFGIGGRSFLPLITSFGCTVPGIMATRTIENEKEKRLTIMISTYFSCGAKLPIWAAFASVLYGGAYRELIVYGVYLFGILIAILAAIFLKRFIMQGQTSGFVSELPTLRAPQAKNVFMVLKVQLMDYLKRAATIIALSVVVIWFLSSFSWNFTMVENIEHSILGQIGKVITVIFWPLGWAQGETGWMFTVASLVGLLAKENVPAVLGTFSGISDTALIGGLSIPAAFSFMAFNLLTIPCMAAVSAARAELQNRRHFYLTLLFWFVNSYLISAVVYWSGVYLWLIPIVIAVIVLGIVLMYVPRKKTNVNEEVA